MLSPNHCLHLDNVSLKKKDGIKSNQCCFWFADLILQVREQFRPKLVDFPKDMRRTQQRTDKKLIKPNFKLSKNLNRDCNSLPGQTWNTEAGEN